ncbi:uncharacterized protein LACBIDRAFT_303298 [Laccaria bicolor S238N-H82]|uniref:Predicted protein n=1 Tax=Laccaria bicolor (strain S238N-H82 / ATCC MYA-4686) TaxID=486041 RepID=B0DJA6_LACBS|nr:uncharacterized protein LACBIDRAFT_303298 [Laccaria bicolor S238N-H82]EDR05370.1 predicted protein [Laccaria bicolor S238N-H82]|eukprot:XP_001883928.1 predicted protein [Laccaria bicolor S238N-H82]
MSTSLPRRALPPASCICQYPWLAVQIPSFCWWWRNQWLRARAARTRIYAICRSQLRDETQDLAPARGTLRHGPDFLQGDINAAIDRILLNQARSQVIVGRSTSEQCTCYSAHAWRPVTLLFCLFLNLLVF